MAIVEMFLMKMVKVMVVLQKLWISLCPLVPFKKSKRLKLSILECTEVRSFALLAKGADYLKIKIRS